jgi:hypothetical protein
MRTPKLTPEVIVMLNTLAQLYTPKGVKQVAVEYKPAKARAKKAPKQRETPQWIIEKAERRTARRALAAEMRAQGMEPNGAAWEAAKKAKGIA